MGISFNDLAGSGWDVTSRLWRFGKHEFDEAGRELRSGGVAIDLESKPIEVLYQLLLHAGEVVTKEELLDAAWSGVKVVEGSLPTAMSKLRKALSDDDQSIIVTIPRVGYRIGVPVQCTVLPPPAPPDLRYHAGDPVPLRDQWRLTRSLDISASSEVWLAHQPKTGEARVFKFAADGIRLRALKREVTLARLLRESQDDRSDFVRILEWNFDIRPYYTESEYGGDDIVAWAESAGGLAAIPMEQRLDVMLQTAIAVAAAHQAGVLHKDLKPANILVAAAAPGKWTVKVADFGSGAVDPARLRDRGITNLGFTGAGSLNDPAITGTLMYLAPEVLAGNAPTAGADVYALGVMLYQLVAGDVRKPLSPGWEADVSDPVLRQDIAEAACGDSKRRIVSAGELAHRLQTLSERRDQQARVAIAGRRAAAAERRRPWIIAAVAVLLTGLAASLILYVSATRARDRANRQNELTEAMNRFLANDLLGRADPFQSGTSKEPLIESIRKAALTIDKQFVNAPEVAARLHHAIARALDNRTEYADAGREYDRAAALSDPENAAMIGFQRAAMEARTYGKDSLLRARSILSAAEQKLAGLQNPRPALEVWRAAAKGMIALIGNNAKEAAEQFQLASSRADQLPDFDEQARLTLKQRLAFSQIRLGDGGRAEKLFKELIDDFTRTRGADSPNVLRVRLNLAQAYMIQNKHKEAIEETTAIYPAYVERLGPDHELTMQLLTTRAQSEGSLGLWDEAIRDDLTVYDRAVKKQGAESFFAVATLSDAALAQCRAGKSKEGSANAQKAQEASAKAFGPRAGLTGGAAYTLAVCWIELGHYEGASKLLNTIDTAAVSQLAGFSDWSANVSLARAQIALAQGDKETARKELQAATPVFSRPDAEAYQKAALTKLLSRIRQK